MKKSEIIIIAGIFLILGTFYYLIFVQRWGMAAKPVIYLYPTEPTKAEV